MTNKRQPRQRQYCFETFIVHVSIFGVQHYRKPTRGITAVVLISVLNTAAATGLPNFPRPCHAVHSHDISLQKASYSYFGSDWWIHVITLHFFWAWCWFTGTVIVNVCSISKTDFSVRNSTNSVYPRVVSPSSSTLVHVALNWTNLRLN